MENRLYQQALARVNQRQTSKATESAVTVTASGAFSPQMGGPMRDLYETVSTRALNVQEEIVGKHNALRRGVIPKARNMLKMEWNENAAQNARNWTKECKKDHSPQFKRMITDSLCGENLLFSSHPLSWSDVIQMWYDESKNFTYGSGPKKPESVVGHYTQTVWATSYMIGCGVAHCPNQETFKYFYTCHYCHGGNNLATFTTPYKKGIPCGDCPEQCDNGLCNTVP
ncbi:serotriflin-like [Petaurus breviceps papuanus]|uniref:serotriflin-like n=1 Tax=Petaurus breviceps papuanus TaxID=3040969 RepID=UPI0036DD133A